MPRNLAPRFALLGLLLLAAATGCEAINAWVGGVSDSSPSPSPAGGITGTVYDSQGTPLAKAVVSDGAHTFETLSEARSFNDRSAGSSSILVGVGGYYFGALPSAPRVVWASFDGVQSNRVTVGPEIGKIKTQDLVIPIDPLPSPGSQVVKYLGMCDEAGNALQVINVSTASAGLSGVYTKYSPGSSVVMVLQSPPGASKVDVGSYKITYQSATGTTLGAGDVGPNNGAVRPLSSTVRVGPASANQSSAPAKVSMSVVSMNLNFEQYLQSAGSIRAKVELYKSASSNGSDPVEDTDQNTVTGYCTLLFGK